MLEVDAPASAPGGPFLAARATMRCTRSRLEHRFERALDQGRGLTVAMFDEA